MVVVAVVGESLEGVTQVTIAGTSAEGNPTQNIIQSAGGSEGASLGDELSLEQNVDVGATAGTRSHTEQAPHSVVGRGPVADSLSNDAVKCNDDNERCKYWASRGECTKNPDYMNEACKKSCNKCGATNDLGR